jgi:hypothetical protein
VPEHRPYVRLVATFRACVPIAALALLVTASPAWARGRVLYVGDSLGVGTCAQLDTMLRGVAVESDTRVGRTSDEGLSILRRRFGRRHDVIVFDLGTNDRSVSTLEHNLELARRLTGTRPMVVFTMNKAGVGPFNRMVSRFARSTRNVDLVDWHSAAGRRHLLGGDGIHASSSGYHRRAELVARRVRVDLGRG